MKRNSILLIEDDELDVISVQRSLNKLGFDYELYTCFNGLEGLNFLNDKLNSDGSLPDIIILDLNMPKMNGIEFLKKFRKKDRFNDIKVFMMTTSGEQADRRAAEDLGISDYLIKPLNFNNNDKRTDSLEGFFEFHLRSIFTPIDAG